MERKEKKKSECLVCNLTTRLPMHLFFFFSLSHLFFFFFSHVISFILYHTNLLLRYAYLSNEHRTKSEIKIKIILFAIMISSFDYVCLLTSITFHFFSAQYSHSSSSIVSRSMNRKREKNLYLVLINFEWKATFRRRSSARSSDLFEAEVPSIQKNLGSSFFFMN